MPYDDIIIGSGLSALAVALGLRGGRRRILIIAGAESGFRHYPGANVPAARGGRGGMGGYWHGVIPLSLQHRPRGLDDESWARLADHFYPEAALSDHIGQGQYFVPRRPIRPADHFAALAGQGEVEIADIDATRIEPEQGADGLHRIISGDQQFQARRIWVCAGALATPALLARSGFIDGGKRSVSDHIIGYAGQIAAEEGSESMMATVARRREGVFFPFRFGGAHDHFFTLRPARFDFAKVDAGIAKRAVFGLPTSRIVSGLAGDISPGLIAEAFYNKFGLFAHAARYSVYFQTVAADAYLIEEDGQLALNPDRRVANAIAAANAAAPFANIARTQQPELYIPGIHLHGSLTRLECDRFGPEREFRKIHLVDAAALRDIGPEHHSFAMMAAAYRRAVTMASQD
ncbi:MAG: hypothetical protein EOP62_22175 [Sphingomonadales bacterium]|nr:MAG: hypothetical protein EOP62_22175 [Sphingomonadales bacterium]